MDELDLASVKRSLQQLDKEVEASRQRVLQLLKTKSSDLEAASIQVSQLKSELQNLELEVSHLVPQPPQPGPVLQLYPKRLEEAAAEHAAVTEELRRIEMSMESLHQIRSAEESWAPLPRCRPQPRHKETPQVGPLLEARQWILDEADDRVLVHLDSRSMEVSPAAEKLARSFVDLASKGEVVMVGQMCHLFAILRPYVQGGLKNSPARCGLFAADVLYLLHTLSQLPEPRPQRQMEVLKRKAQEEMGAMLRHQEEGLLAALRPLELYGDFVVAETALGAASEKLRAVAALRGLPRRLVEEVALQLLGRFCQELFLKLPKAKPTPTPAGPAGRVAGVTSRLLETARHAAQAVQGEDELREMLAGLRPKEKEAEARARNVLAAEDVSSAVALLTSAQSLVRQTLQAAKLPELQAKVLGFEKLQLCSELLGSELSRFVERRKKLRRVMKKEEVLKLMDLSFYDEALSPEEAWQRILH